MHIELELNDLEYKKFCTPNIVLLGIETEQSSFYVVK